MIQCSNCGSLNINKNGQYKGMQRYKCKECNTKFCSGIYIEKSYITHFGIRIENKNLHINKENYAKINKRNSFRNSIFSTPIYSEDIYEDESCATYTNDYCQKHQEACLKNFDLNMKYFELLDFKEFNEELTKLLKRFKKLKKIKNLNRYDIPGIYVMVLDNFKQVYIGKAKSIKKRIVQHWKKNKEFDRLIFGFIKTSVISIDSFRALDTTQIFVYPISESYQNRIEEKIVNFVNEKFKLNRVRGGDLTNLKDINIHCRKL